MRFRIYTRVAVLAGSLGVLLHLPALAAYWNVVERICLERFAEYLEIVDIPVPVGCEIIDCCPGCPEPDQISWRIRLEGDLVEEVTLEFENLAYGMAQRLEFDGTVGRLSANQIVVGRGEGGIRGLRVGSDGLPPVALPRFSVDEAGLARYIAGHDQNQSKTDQDEDVKLAIDQLSGPVVVNSFVLRYFVSRCVRAKEPQPSDEIDLNSNAGNDNAWILVDGRRNAGCQNDEIYRTTDVAHVGNLLTSGTCNSEVFVFSDDDAMTSPYAIWTNAADDNVPVDLGPILQAPINVWLARAGSGPQAATDVAQANMLFNNNNTGISFIATTTEVSGNAAAQAAIGGAADRCSMTRLATLQSSAFYAANQLNVYYIKGGFRASNCVFDRNVVHVGSLANIASLAHEFGHSFSLFGNASTGGHTNGLADFGNNNLMWGGGAATRNRFTIGQAFRFNMNKKSSLNVNGVRSGPTRVCQALTTSAACPALALDSAPL